MGLIVMGINGVFSLLFFFFVVLFSVLFLVEWNGYFFGYVVLVHVSQVMTWEGEDDGWMICLWGRYFMDLFSKPVRSTLSLLDSTALYCQWCLDLVVNGVTRPVEAFVSMR